MIEFSPGAEIAGYRIESVIGRGGMAVVYRAEDSRLGRKVALKLLAPVLAQNQHFQQRFIRESRLAASLDHPNIVPIYEAGESDGHLFIAMRYVPGSDLKAVLAEEQRMSPARLLRLFVQIGDALDAAHLLGLVHRDVKPGNILVSSVTEHSGHAHPDHVYLTDFGLTKRTSSLSGSLTEAGHFLGTVDYVSPEQIQGGPLGPATDTYALGGVLYECLTGQLPFNRDDDAAVLWAHLVEMPPPVTAARPDLPPAIDDVVSRAMAKAPEDRYDSCSDMMRDLEQALEAGTDLSGLHSASTRPAARHRRATGAGSGSLPGQRPAPPSRMETAPPLPVDPDATRGWVSHPSLPPGTIDPPRWPVPLEDEGEEADNRTSHDEEGVAARAGADVATDDAYDSYDATDHPDGDDADPQDLNRHYADDPYLDENDEDEEPYATPAAVSPPEPLLARRRWLLPAAALAVVTLVVAVALYLVQSRKPEPFTTYSTTNQESAVAFSVSHPLSWTTMPGSNEFVIAPRAHEVADVFIGQAGWGTGRDVLRSSPDDAMGLYVTSRQVPVDTSANFLQVWISDTLSNSKVTGITSNTQPTIGGLPGYELEGTLSDGQPPGSTLHAVFDVVVLPSKGTVLLTFFAPPSRFEAERPLFATMLKSVKFPD
jgi:serine/threonine protein kinase